MSKKRQKPHMYVNLAIELDGFHGKLQELHPVDGHVKYSLHFFLMNIFFKMTRFFFDYFSLEIRFQQLKRYNIVEEDGLFNDSIYVQIIFLIDK